MFEVTRTPTASRYPVPEGLSITADFKEGHAPILSAEALQFLANLHRRFNAKRKSLLIERQSIQEKIDSGWRPDFLPETAIIRTSDWKIAAVPDDIADRRVEITGPVDRKMIINALNSGARVFMADFEDSNAPSWINIIEGQVNLYEAVRKTISFTAGDKKYQLNEQVATLFVRPRGWHLQEKHILVDGEPMSASLVDFGLYFFHNGKYLLSHGSGPYFYLPKLEHYKEARLWDDVFVFAQNYCGVPFGSIKATVLIETILASFQLDEILWELRDHSAGLNCGRWDYIFSYIKKFRSRPGMILPDRAQVTMTVPFLKAYSHLVIKTCHRRGAHAMGGMAAQIPIKNKPEANEKAMEKVMNDKLREVKDGHDGTWVAHPALVPIAMNVFDQHMPETNQVKSDKQLHFTCSAADLLAVPEGSITETGMRTNINVGILYMESWLRGNGAAAIYNLMEDAATAEISRTQLWQWIRHKAYLEDGRKINLSLYESFRDDEIEKIREMIGSKAYSEGKFPQAIALFNRMVTQPQFEEFLTLPAYDFLVTNEWQ